MELSLALLGIVASLFVSWLKRFIDAKRNRVIAAVLTAFVAAGLYALLLEFDLWSTFRQVLVYAGAFYAFIWKHVEPEESESTSSTWRSD